MSPLLYGSQGKFTWRMGATVLGGQSLAVFFGSLVARSIADADGGSSGSAYLVVGSALAVACLLGAGLMRRPYGVTVGWILQGATLASALVVPAMLLVGAIFLALWVWCLVSGRRIDARMSASEQAAGPVGQ